MYSSFYNLIYSAIHISNSMFDDSLYEFFQSTYVEERGKLNIFREFDERMIWTSESVPLMASYNKGLNF